MLVVAGLACLAISARAMGFDSDAFSALETYSGSEADTEEGASADAVSATVAAILRSNLGGDTSLVTEADLETLNAAEADMYTEAELAQFEASGIDLEKLETPPHREGFKYKLHFASFAGKFKRAYKPEESEKRYSNWKGCVDRIAHYNGGKLKGASWQIGYNRFCDRHEHERQAMLGFRSRSAKVRGGSEASIIPDPNNPRDLAKSQRNAMQPRNTLKDSDGVSKNPSHTNLDDGSVPMFRQQFMSSMGSGVEVLDATTLDAAHFASLRDGMDETIRASTEEQIKAGTMDWRTQGAITPVRFQGSCGVRHFAYWTAVPVPAPTTDVLMWCCVVLLLRCCRTVGRGLQRVLSNQRGRSLVTRWYRFRSSN